MDSQSFQHYNFSGANSSGAGDADLHAGENTARNGLADHERRDHNSSDVASSALFAADAKRHDELKRALDSMQRDTIKLDAMRRVMALVAAGQDCSDLFSIIVKNVVTKDSELKKLVFMYIARYAEQQQDLVLLSISTFQRALKDPNQLIRAHALRVLSSIRVSIIVPIMMLAIKDAANDMSPYVRRTAAHSIPKLYHIDPEQLDQLLQVIEKLLGDKSTIVVGSAAQAFMEVCPERLDLLHKNFRKLCNLLIDVDEWGQVVLINLLMRYSRNQFADPNGIDPSADARASSKFYSDEDTSSSSSSSSSGDDDDDDEEGEGSGEKGKKKKAKEKGAESSPSKSSGARVMDPDHRLLLRSCRPLLSARSPAVVMAVVQLFLTCAPRAELELNNGGVFRALFRLLRGTREVQYTVLHTLASISVERERALLEAHLRALFVHANEPTSIKLLKLEILTNLANERNVSAILREMDAYVASSDKQLAAAAVQAIGRVACALPQVSDACLGGLVQLLSLKDENLVAEAVVVIKKLLQMQAAEHKEIVVQLARLLDAIAVPMARASILWLIGEYVDCVPKLAPDILRRSVKQFIECEDIVKLQILNLAAKLFLTNAKQTRLLVQYVLTLARYDQNYDIRDRARFLTHLLLPPAPAASTSSSSSAAAGSEQQPQQQQQPPHHLHRYLKRIFFAPKPAPVLESSFKNRNNFMLGTLSSLSNVSCAGYEPLADWPETPPDPSVRHVPVPPPTAFSSSSLHTVSPQHGGGGGRSGDAGSAAQSDKPFYSDEERAEEAKSDEEKGDEEEEKEKEEEEESEKGSDESDGEKSARRKPKKGAAESGSEEEKSGSEQESESSSEEADEDDEEAKPASSAKERAPAPKSGATRTAAAAAALNSSRPTKSESDEDTESESGSEDDEEAEKEKASGSTAADKRRPAATSAAAAKAKAGASSASKGPSADALLLDFDVDSSAAAPALTPSAPLVAALTPSTTQTKSSSAAAPTTADLSMIAPPASVASRSFELISKSSSGGLVSATYRFTRNVSAYSSTMASVELAFVNQSDSAINSIKLTSKKLTGGMTLQEFAEVARLAPRASTSSLLAVDFKDSAQPAQFDVQLSVAPANSAAASGAGQQRTVSCAVRAPIGEQMRPYPIGEAEFTRLRAKLRGMNEQSESLSLAGGKRVEVGSLLGALYFAAHVGPVSYSGSSSASAADASATAGGEWVARFAARTISESHLVLVVLACAPSALRLSVHCEKMLLVSLIAGELKQALADALRTATGS